MRPEDFRVVRYRQPRGATTIFVVDASGSAAMQRLAEVKGAIELLLADCYVRRDSVAVVAFRGAGRGDRSAADALDRARQAPACRDCPAAAERRSRAASTRRPRSPIRSGARGNRRCSS